ncbi:MAG: hypothetical protein KA765_01795 [Thermoflexales bacterium]|nr:hypothetical protein [Thermoflexales bacterium]
MDDNLSILNLLNRLKKDLPKMASDQIDQMEKALDLAVDAMWLSRRHHHAEAIRAAEKAVYLARHKAEIHGIALLYLGAVRFETEKNEQRQMAFQDCTHAIRELALYPHNRALAEAVCAQTALGLNQARSIVTALDYLGKAANTLKQLGKEALERGKKLETEGYENLRAEVLSLVEQLNESLITIKSESIGSVISDSRPVSQASASTPEPPKTTGLGGQRIKLTIPTQLVWPVPESTKIEILPVFGDAKIDFVDAFQLSLNGKLYRVESANPKDDSGSVRIQVGQQYAAYETQVQPRRRVLVRCQDWLEQSLQQIVVADDIQHKVWIDDAESNAPYTLIHVIGADRSWSTTGSSAHTEPSPRIIGIVEAILTPVTA